MLVCWEIQTNNPEMIEAEDRDKRHELMKTVTIMETYDKGVDQKDEGVPSLSKAFLCTIKFNCS